MANITIQDPNHPSHLVEEVMSLREAGELFDYTIMGKEKTFPIHRVVLAAMSPVFRALLRSDMKESAKKESTFPSIPDDIVAVIIDFAYSGVTTFTGPQLMEVLKAAHYLQMSKLLKLCEEKITVVAEPSNCFSWAQLAERLGLSYIASTVQKMLRATYSEVIKAKEYKQLEKEELVKYLTDVQGHGTCSDDLVSGALQWIKHDMLTRSAHTSYLFTLVNIGKCSEHYLLQLVDDNAELFEMEQSMYKMILSDVLNASKPALLGKDKTILILGGESSSGHANFNSWILQKDQLVKFHELREETLCTSHSICLIPCGLMLTGGFNRDLCIIFVFSGKTVG